MHKAPAIIIVTLPKKSTPDFTKNFHVPNFASSFRQNAGFSGCGGPVFAETRSACYDLPNRPKLIDIVYGLGGRDCAVEDVLRVYSRLQNIVTTGELGPVYTHMGQREREAQ